jgi:hypothetical protein
MWRDRIGHLRQRKPHLPATPCNESAEAIELLYGELSWDGGICGINRQSIKVSGNAYGTFLGSRFEFQLRINYLRIDFFRGFPDSFDMSAGKVLWLWIQLLLSTYLLIHQSNHLLFQSYIISAGRSIEIHDTGSMARSWYVISSSRSYKLSWRRKVNYGIHVMLLLKSIWIDLFQFTTSQPVSSRFILKVSSHLN